MKKAIPYFLLGLTLPLFNSCIETVEPLSVSAYQPILMSRAQLESSVKMTEPLPISRAGKLYQYGHFILVNEQYKGVHLIDNQNPAAPVKLGFLQVPGSVDFAVKANVLYVDNAVDLVAINLNNIQEMKVSKRIRNTFPVLLPPDNLPTNYEMAGAPEDAVIVGWELTQTK